MNSNMVMPRWLTEVVYGSKEVFFYISNEQRNLLHLSFNLKHPWGRLFIERSDDLSVKTAAFNLCSNMVYAMFDLKQPLTELYEFDGEYHRLVLNTFDHSTRTKGIFKKEILDSLNKYLYRKNDSALLEHYGLMYHPLTERDFVSWWFA